MKSIKYVIPSLLTLTNLVLGIVAIIVVFRGQNEYMAAWFIFIAAFFDLTDGLVARLLDAKTEFGKQLDSLADMVSFGIAPSIILFQWLYIVLTKLSPQSTFSFNTADVGQIILLLGGLLFAVTAAIRLARFNTSQADRRGFIGLPSPAAGLIVATLWLMVDGAETEGGLSILLNIYFVYAVLLLLCILMISNIKMLSMKFKGIGIVENLFQYILIFVGIFLIVVFGRLGILFSLLAYIALSISLNFFPAKN